ncbi:MAG: tRNA pseudouridine(55) synthase TruB [Deltaproteobacteria bacterium]|nr:tRNA pseudouridine(55) synthase TruB [Deltaproteobacteria bacterium]
MDGILVLDKPPGPTSFDVVRRVRTVLRLKKVGHTGTLDPAATGVLPLCLGDATRVAGYVTERDKAYEALVRLGEETDTQDATGKVLASAPVPAFSPAELEAALDRFRGTFLQVPPMYSAVKVQGKRLYELAREGKEVERAAREVTVHRLCLVDRGAEQLRLEVHCSKGFFVRTLAHELGRALGCGAHLQALRRTRSGPFTLSQALPLQQLEALAADRAGLAARLVSVEVALCELPELRVGPADAERVRHGVPVEGHGWYAGMGKLRVTGPDGKVLAVAEVDASGRLRFSRVLVQP